MTAQREYYAIEDTEDLGVGVTFWYRNGKGVVTEWPKSAKIGPFYREEGRTHRRELRQAGLFTEAAVLVKAASVEQWAWRAAVLDSLLDDEVRVGAMVLFSRLQSRCCFCSRQLTDERSKVYGIGPECRSDLEPDVLDLYMLRMTGRAFEKALS